MLYEEISSVFKYIKSSIDNIVTNTISCIPFSFLEKVESSVPSATRPLPSSPLASTAGTLVTTFDLFINYPLDLSNFPLEFESHGAAQ